MAAMNSSAPSRDTIAERAYQLWEAQGRPDGRAEEFWLQAERDLQPPDGGDSGEPSVVEPADEVNDRKSNDTGPEISNLDRALPPRARREVRALRHSDGGDAAPASDDEQPHHYLVLLDRAHLRIYGLDDPSAVPALLTGLDAPAGKKSYAAEDSDQAGQFPGARKSKSRGATSSGGTIDERLPMQEERDRRLAQDWAERLDAFLRQQPNSTWDYAAGPALHHAVLDRLSSSARHRLRSAIQKDLTNQPPTGLRDHFPSESRSRG